MVQCVCVHACVRVHVCACVCVCVCVCMRACMCMVCLCTPFTLTASLSRLLAEVVAFFCCVLLPASQQFGVHHIPASECHLQIINQRRKNNLCNSVP